MGCGYVGSLTVDLHLAEADSLKDKRKHVQRVKAGLAKRFSCPVAEVDQPDRPRRRRLTLAVVTREGGDLGGLLDAASRWLHGDPAFEVLGESRELRRVDDTAGLAVGNG